MGGRERAAGTATADTAAATPSHDNVAAAQSCEEGREQEAEVQGGDRGDVIPVTMLRAQVQPALYQVTWAVARAAHGGTP